MTVVAGAAGWPAAPLRVMVLHAPTGVGGAEGVILALNRFLDPVRIRLINCPFVNLERGRSLYLEELDRRGIPYHVVPLRRRFERRYVSATRNLIRREGIHLIHSHGYRSDITALLAARGLVPVVSTVHGFTASTSRVRLYEALQRLVLTRMRRVVAVSAAIEGALLRQGLAPEQVRRLGNVVDLEAVAAAGEGPAPEALVGAEGLKLAFVGRLSPEKGLDVLLDACASLAAGGVAFTLFVVGEGPLAAAYRRRAEEVGLSRTVRFLGFRRDAAAIMAAADLCVLPSRSEGMPLAVMEAMALGRPVVAASVGAVPSLVSDGETGVLFAPGDAAALARALMWVSGHREESAQMGARARRRVAERCSPAAWARDMASIYTEAAGDDGRAV